MTMIREEDRTNSKQRARFSITGLTLQQAAKLGITLISYLSSDLPLQITVGMSSDLPLQITVGMSSNRPVSLFRDDDPTEESLLEELRRCSGATQVGPTTIFRFAVPDVGNPDAAAKLGIALVTGEPLAPIADLEVKLEWELRAPVRFGRKTTVSHLLSELASAEDRGARASGRRSHPGGVGD